MQKGSDLLWCFSVVAIQTKRWTGCKQHRVGRDILSILPLLAISTKIRSSVPTREAVDAKPFSKLDPRMSLSHHPDLRISRLPGYE
jgi:hypothetical protein